MKFSKLFFCVFFATLLNQLSETFCHVNLRIFSKLHPRSPNPLKLPKSGELHGEVHSVITRDGYILDVHRVRRSNSINDLPVVLMLHGIFESSMIFLMDREHKGSVAEYEKEDRILEEPADNLAFALADQGFDVWLLNSRGNSFSSNHTTFSNQDPSYWDYTLSEMALEDLPATIDYIQKITRQNQLSIVGHSQGALLVLWLLAERTEYSEILSPVVLLNPLTTVDKISKIKLTGNPIVQYFARVPILIGPVYQRSEIFNELVSANCQTQMTKICPEIFDLAGMPIDLASNASNVAFYSHYLPEGVSFNTIKHYIQAVQLKKLLYYDHGPLGNYLKYRTRFPAEIPWNRINSSNIVVFDQSQNSDRHVVNVFGQEIAINPDNFHQVISEESIDLLLSKAAGHSIDEQISSVIEKLGSLIPPPTPILTHERKLKIKITEDGFE